MEKNFIIRNLCNTGAKKIEITKEEIEKIAEIYNCEQQSSTIKYYKKQVIKMIKTEYSTKFSQYMIKNHDKYIEQLAENCYYNQDAIDNIGINFIFDLEKYARETLDNYYKQMCNNLETKNFIDELVNSFENLTRGDLQGIVQARCIKTGENEDEILKQIDIKIGGK